MGSKIIESGDIAGAVILYNSSPEVINNIKTYISQISILYVIDNSTQPNEALNVELAKIDKVKYTYLEGNQGIAVALNCAAQQAILDKYSILLTMDDDTQTPLNMIPGMIDFWNQYPDSIGILSGVHHTKPDKALYRSLPYTLTSGNLLNLEAYEIIGGFNDNLFIDHVDHEYGLRLNDVGYQVVELPSIRLRHRLGYRQEFKIGKWNVGTYGTHSPIRLYYYARNGVYIARSYFKHRPKFAFIVIKELVKRLIKAVILSKDRLNRVTMITKGIIDGWKGKLGPYLG